VAGLLAAGGAAAGARRELFNGNTEGFRDWFDPEHPVQWSMRAYATRRADLERRFADPAFARIHKVRLRRPAAARWWLDRVGGQDRTLVPT
jgi:hypothetical protein